MAALKQYNNTEHSSIKVTPIEASKKKNESTVYFSLHSDIEQLSSKPQFKAGDKVRIGTHLIGLKRYSWLIKSIPQIQSPIG